MLLGLFASFASHYFELTGMGIFARMGDMKAERPTRMKMTTWVTLNYILKVAKMKSATLVPKIHNFIPNIPFAFKISPTNHLLSKYLKETTCSRGLPRTLVSLLALLSLSPFLDSTKEVLFIVHFWSYLYF